MMLLLAFDVLDDFVHLRHADTKSAILFLPAEEAVFGEGFVHPFGGATFDELQRFATASVDGKESRICTWSATPPISRAAILFCRAIPPTNGQSLARSAGVIRGRRSLSPNTQ